MSMKMIDVNDPTEIFAAPQGEARISSDTLATLPNAGADFGAALKLYVEMHPKLDVVTLIHRSKDGDDELVVRWRWRS